MSPNVPLKSACIENQRITKKMRFLLKIIVIKFGQFGKKQ